MRFRRFFAERAIRELPGFREIEERFPGLEWIENYREFHLDTVHREKQSVILARKRGRWLKPFHCYFHNFQYRYLGLDLAEGCPYDCVYCYLQTYLNHGALVMFVDMDSLESELRSAGSGAWISTGLLTDSLLAETAFPVLPRISKLVPEGSVLDLRTKSAGISCLEDAAISRGRVVVSWSINPQRIAQSYEYGAAPASERLQAARAALSLGYRIAFHLDPVFYFDGWRDAYDELIRELMDFPGERIAYLSLGLFRYMPDLGTEIRSRFPYHEILTGEFFPDEDGKYHYFRGIRKEMHRAFQEWLRPWDDRVPVFWSMEPERKFLEPV